MSFADLEAGRPLPSRRLQQQQKSEPSQVVAAGIFKINTAVATFQRLVDSVGTPKDTLDLRDRLHKTRLQIGELVKETSGKLREASQTDLHFQVTATKKIADAKLAKDFQAVLKEFQKAQRLAAQRETAYAPFVPKQPPSPPSNQYDDDRIISLQKHQHQALLLDSKRQEAVLLDNELIFNEAIIEEREQGIQEIQHQISEVNEIFKDLHDMISSQGQMIDDVSSNIESSHSATAQGTSQLIKASKNQKSSSSLVCLLLVIFGIILLIVIIVVVF